MAKENFKLLEDSWHKSGLRKIVSIAILLIVFATGCFLLFLHLQEKINLKKWDLCNWKWHIIDCPSGGVPGSMIICPFALTALIFFEFIDKICLQFWIKHHKLK